MRQDVIQVACDLICYPSITPDDAGCQAYIHDYLTALKFDVQTKPCGAVSNLWATHGQGAPYLLLAGHTDVVSPGANQQWQTPPFTPVISNGKLHGRGVTDMKGALAAMMVAASNFLQLNPNHPGTLAFLITSGEEGDDYLHGTPAVLESLQVESKYFDWCILGEPTSETRIGDTIKIGRRGSLNAQVIIPGKQGHVAYPDKACNPIHQATALIHMLSKHTWQDGNEQFPATQLQITQLNAGDGSYNIIPDDVQFKFNIRYGNNTQSELQAELERLILTQHIDAQIKWQHSGAPFISQLGTLATTLANIIKSHQGIQPVFSTSGGTSDGRFLNQYVKEMVELGLLNQTAHQINEHCSIDDLQALTCMYQSTVSALFKDHSKDDVSGIED